MSDKLGSVLLVGSVPLESAEAVFRTCSQELGEYVWCLPDGEVGDRTIWVVFQAYRVFHEHPAWSRFSGPNAAQSRGYRAI